MRKRLQLILGLSDERGATAIIIGLLMVVFIGIAAVAIDIGYAMATRNELQNIADGSALAATGWLGDNYSDMTETELLNYDVSGDEADIRLIAKAVASQNAAGGVGNIILNDSDIEIGKWDDSITIDDSLRGTVNDPRFTTLQAGEIPDAVRVTARRETGLNGPINTFFARIFGTDDVGVNAIATAALTGIDEVAECELFLPVGISKAWFDYWNNQTGNYCDHDIRMYPTGDIDGCAGWHVFEDWPANDPKLIDLVKNNIQGNCNNGAETDDEFVYTGGTLGNAFDYMEDLFNLMKDCQSGSQALQDLLDKWYEADPSITLTIDDLLLACTNADGLPYDLDEDPTSWTTHVVIYDVDDCSNPHGYIRVAGFATVRIYHVDDVPDKLINATVKCLGFADGRGGGSGGGSAFGTMGTIPGLVQ